MSKSTISTFQLFEMFPDQESARLCLEARLWPHGPVCPECGSLDRITARKGGYYRCNPCKLDFTIRTGTIFERSHVPLHKWLYAMYLVVTARKGISSMQLAKEIGVTQKTAWFMLHRIRLAMQDENGGKLSGEVEVDETFIGGKARNMHKERRERVITGRGPQGKEVVFGMVARGGKVIAGHVDSRKKKDLQPLIRERIEAGAAIFSDELKSYDGLESDYQHAVINHAVEYVNGNVHTNTMENFWSLLKRGLHGTYISVEPYHLFRYIDEQAFRYNNRNDMNDFDRFKLLLSGIVGKRLTYDALIGSRKEAETEAC
jgi:transposase-like protein